MVKTERVEWIDICKGFAIILVVLGHSIRPEMMQTSILCSVVYNFIYSFHMALFMVLSGMVFRLQMEKNKIISAHYIKKRFIKLGIPFVSYSLVLYIIFLIANCMPGIDRLLSSTGYCKIDFFQYIRFALMGDNPYGVHMWFIYCLLIVSLIGILIPRIHEKRTRWIIVGLVLCVWTLRYVLEPQMVIVFRVMLYGMYYFLGMVWKDIFHRTNRPRYILLSLLAWGLICWHTRMCILEQDVSVLHKFLINVMVCMCIDNIICLSKMVYGKVGSILIFCGKNSFSIYLFHQPFFCAVIATVLLKLQLPNLMIIFCSLSLGMICPLLIVECLKKCKILNWLTVVFGVR